MSSFPNEAAFSLDPLSLFDPRQPEEMAEIVLGTYAINAKAIKAGVEAVKAYIKPDDVRYKNIELIVGLAAKDNLGKIRDLLGTSAVTAVAVDIDREPIRFKGISTVPEATGFPLP